MSFMTRLSLFVRHGMTLATIVVATFTCLAASAFNQIYDFSTAAQNWRHDFGGTGTPTIDPAQNSPGNAQGAQKLVFDFPFASGGIAFTGDKYFPGQDLTADPTLLFDVMVDPASPHDAFGNYGFFKFSSRETDNYNYNTIFQGNLPGISGWQTFSAPTSTLLATRAFSFELYGGPSQNIPAPLTLWLDNIRTVPEPESVALMGIALSGCLGLARRSRSR